MKPLGLFSNLIFKAHLPVNWGLIGPRCETFIQEATQHQNRILDSTGGTTVSHPALPHEFPEFNQLNFMLGNYLEQAKAAWDLRPIPYHCCKSWLNWHYKGGQLEEHDHNVMNFVVTYYLQKPMHSGHIEFKNPLEYHWCGYETNQQIWKEVPAIAGDILIFPGWLKHRVQPNRVDDRRLVLTMNYIAG
jgi:uncharacterized protein (TIGR02466 family)